MLVNSRSLAKAYISSSPVGEFRLGPSHWKYKNAMDYVLFLATKAAASGQKQVEVLKSEVAPLLGAGAVFETLLDILSRELESTVTLTYADGRLTLTGWHLMAHEIASEQREYERLKDVKRKRSGWHDRSELSGVLNAIGNVSVKYTKTKKPFVLGKTSRHTFKIRIENPGLGPQEPKKYRLTHIFNVENETFGKSVTCGSIDELKVEISKAEEGHYEGFVQSRIKAKQAAALLAYESVSFPSSPYDYCCDTCGAEYSSPHYYEYPHASCIVATCDGRAKTV